MSDWAEKILIRFWLRAVLIVLQMPFQKLLENSNFYGGGGGGGRGCAKRRDVHLGGEWVKRGGWNFWGGWRFSESNFQLMMKYYIRYKSVNYSSHHVFYLLTIFKCLEFKLKTLHEYKALISFKFANKDIMIRKTFWKYPIHYVNSTFRLLENSLTEKGKYLVIESSYFYE